MSGQALVFKIDSTDWEEGEKRHSVLSLLSEVWAHLNQFSEMSPYSLHGAGQSALSPPNFKIMIKLISFVL